MSEEITQLKEQEKQQTAAQDGTVVSAGHRAKNGRSKNKHNQSITGPLILIAIGAYFLARNFGWVDLELNWWIFGQFWPLILIFVGFNIVANQVKGGFGRLLQFIVGLSAITVFGWLLLFGSSAPFIGQFVPTIEPQIAELSLARQEVETAEVTINFSNASATLDALDDSPNLLSGNVSYLDDVNADLDVDGSFAELTLSTDDNSWSGWGVEMEPWDIGLNTSVATDLTLNLSNGRTTLDLDQLDLTYLYIDAANGYTEITLPSGDYDIDYDAANGAANLVLPAAGQHNMTLDGANGSMTIELPPTMEARIEVDDANGRFSMPRHLELVSGEADDDSVWETPNYREDAPNVINIDLEMGNGSVRFESGEGTGR